MSTASEEKNVSTKDTPTDVNLCPPNTFEGIVVGVSGNKLVMANKVGRQYSHTLAGDAQLTCDGTPCQAVEFTSGTKVRVTTKKNDPRIATGIEAIKKNAQFAGCG